METLTDRLFRSMEDAASSETVDKPLTRAQKKNVRKKQKKKEKKSAEVAFEIEEITTGFEEVSLSEKTPDKESGGRKTGDEVSVNLTATSPAPFIIL